ncbi:MAG TPA: hypothetical protein PKA63_13230 [Oligoflexia bacterium]|nr:hypothetical protein [Oligoflexia bacterium]HMP49623.1 hypothetical protein [Oligoflexia bacterium]
MTCFSITCLNARGMELNHKIEASGKEHALSILVLNTLSQDLEIPEEVGKKIQNCLVEALKLLGEQGAYVTRICECSPEENEEALSVVNASGNYQEQERRKRTREEAEATLRKFFGGRHG